MTLPSETVQPVPLGRYVPAKRHGDLIFTSGMTPRDRGVLVAEGRVRAGVPVTDYAQAVVLACRNALQAASALTSARERIDQIISLTVFIAAEPEFTAHSRLADFASEFFFQEFGEAGIGSRAAVGVATLPGSAIVEIQVVAAAGPERDGRL